MAVAAVSAVGEVLANLGAPQEGLGVSAERVVRDGAYGSTQWAVVAR